MLVAIKIRMPVSPAYSYAWLLKAKIMMLDRSKNYIIDR
jgi:hypothetical protein